LRILFYARSKILPGVPTTTCTVFFNFKISYFTLVPPVITNDYTFKYFPIFLIS